MTIDELRAPYGLSRRTIHQLVYRKVLDPPVGPKRYARYLASHREQLRSYMALRHSNVTALAAAQLCREEGISLSEFLDRRRASIRDFGFGVA